MAANTSLVDAAKLPGAAEERPVARRDGTAISALLRHGMLGGFAALGVMGSGAHTPTPTQAELRSFSGSRLRLIRLTGTAR